ncbi:hypothetical protein ACFQ07_29865 [Actinomadura adrarensis]|uniref:FXSXX-COOH protein n=1 Tax=Actinomadura adrarensis TaxID=1819600 RepID=A0ABW3CPK5_9ACTN
MADQVESSAHIDLVDTSELSVASLAVLTDSPLRDVLADVLNGSQPGGTGFEDGGFDNRSR